MTIAVFILGVNTNVENWSVNTGLTGIRRNMIHLENSWLLSWKILAAQKLGSKHSTHRDTLPRLPKKYDTPVVICLCLQTSRYQFIHKYSFTNIHQYTTLVTTNLGANIRFLNTKPTSYPETRLSWKSSDINSSHSQHTVTPEKSWHET